MMNALSFSGSDFKLTVSEPHRDDGEQKASKSGHSLSPTSSLQIPLQIPGSEKAPKLSLRTRPALTEDGFEKREKSPKSEELSSPGTPMILLTPDDEDSKPSLFVPSIEDDEQVERLNQGRNWNDIEAEAVGKEKFRQVLNELLTKRGKQLPVGEQDKGDEENYELMAQELQKRKTHDETAPKETGIKKRKTGGLSLDA